MSTGVDVLLEAHQLYARNGPPTPEDRPPVYKAVGIALAIASGVFIGTSFVLKKTGLLKANVKYNEEAGEGYGYLKNAFWWGGMTLMIIGEICNFVAYAFVDAILVTPLGALSVVITTILSAIFLKERLSFVGKIGCFLCIIGSVIILLSAPSESSVGTIQRMQHFMLAPGFLSYAGVVILGCAFIAFWVAPRYGKKSMLVYLSICSLIGGLSVVATQGLGAAIVAQAGGTKQYDQPFLYILFVFVILTLVTEIIYLNKALNIFNAALVTPTYYVFFTSATIITSAILFQGFKGSVPSIITVVLGFLVICCGVVLLQLSKSAKDVPDTEVFKGDLDQVRTVAEQEQPESEPKADAIRGTAAIIRRLSNSRQKMEAQEAKRVHEDKLKDQMEPIGEDEQVQWDGLRRRKTTLSLPPQGLQRKRTIHPPLGMAHFPEEDEQEPATSGANSDEDERGGAFDGGFMSSIRRRAQSTLLPSQRRNLGTGTPNMRSPMHPVALTEISLPGYTGSDTPATAQFPDRPDKDHVYGLPPGLSDPAPYSLNNKPITFADPPRLATPSSLAPTPPPHSARRQFSFQNVFHRHRGGGGEEDESEKPATPRPTSRKGLTAPTEEERMGLVHGNGDSSSMLPLPEYTSEDEGVRGEKEGEGYDRRRESGRERERDVEKEWEWRRGGGGVGGGGGAFI